MSLTDSKIRSLVARDRRLQLADRDGLYIDVALTQRKTWRYKYSIDGRQKWHTIGDYPTITLEEARRRVAVLRQRLRDTGTVTEEQSQTVTFGEVMTAWLAEHDAKLSDEKGRRRARRRAEMHIAPLLAHRAITDIRPVDVLPVLDRIADAHKHELVLRIRSMISQVFRYAAARGIDVADPTTALVGAHSAPPPRHFACLTDPRDIGALMAAIDAYPTPVMRAMLLFSAYTFCRPGEIRAAEWHEVDTAACEWRIPADKTKMSRPHVVPLARQAVELLERLALHTGASRWLFCAERTPHRPMSADSVAKALKTLGYRGRMTAHGFRGMASTILNENGFNSDWIERQLAHVEQDRVRGAYNHADFLPDRRVMMQAYADILDDLKDRAKNIK